ncbi:MAG: hypothetical protein ACK50A_04135 [Sphingobacteriaceae bacterium]
MTKAVNLLVFLFLFGINIYCKSQNQNVLLKDFKSNSLTPATVVSGKVEIKTKQWPISIEVQGESVSKIVLMRAGVLEEVYQPDVPSYPSYFYTSENRLCFLKGIFIYYRMNSGNPDISYLLSDDVEKLKSADANKIKQDLIDYFAQIKVEQTGAKENLKEELSANKEKEKLENSIKGKNIKKIEIVWLTKDSETGMQSKIQFGVKATDVSGKIFSTDNLGGKTSWEDFDINSKGAVAGDEYLTVETDATKITNDMVSLTVKSKYHPGVSVNSSIKLSYVTPVKLVYAGKHGCPPLISGTGTRGGRAPDAELNVCNSKDNQFVFIEVKIGGVILHRVKLKKDIGFYLDVTGGGGCSGKSQKSSNGEKGGDGGDGGNITINKSAGLTGDNLNLYNSGGKGGSGGKGKPFDGPTGSSGRSGETKYFTKAIQLNY